MAVGIFAFIDAHFFQIVIRGQCRISCLHFGVQILQPLRLCTAFGKPLIHIVAEASGDFAEYPVDGLALELRRRRRLDKNQISHIAGVIIGDDILLFDGHEIRQ